jgi:hypothetical protein
MLSKFMPTWCFSRRWPRLLVRTELRLTHLVEHMGDRLVIAVIPNGLECGGKVGAMYAE